MVAVDSWGVHVFDLDVSLVQVFLRQEIEDQSERLGFTLRRVCRNELILKILANLLPDLVGFDQIGCRFEQLEVR